MNLSLKVMVAMGLVDEIGALHQNEKHKRQLEASKCRNHCKQKKLHGIASYLGTQVLDTD